MSVILTAVLYKDCFQLLTIFYLVNCHVVVLAVVFTQATLKLHNVMYMYCYCALYLTAVCRAYVVVVNED